MVDVFEEVEEQLRSARYLSMVKKGWPWALGAVVLALLVTFAYWGWTSYRAAESAKASEAYQTAFDAMARNDGPAADAAFAAVAKSGPAGYRALALMQQAGLRTSQGKNAEAIALFDQAAKVAPAPLIGDAAKLKAAYLVFDNATLPELEARLSPLAVAGRPYAALAREALAMKRLTTGHTAEARQAFALLAISPDAGEALQARAQIAMNEIDAGQAPNLPAVVRAAAAMTPEAVKAAKLAAAQAAAVRAAAERAAQIPPGAGPPPSQAGAAQ
ncbi:MAG TPA: tetratricopeptide repeat protein [Caulobacteraceae bacterium]|nr:tetratricopeptide repeat protein [Caulobacteraceae bacterium]